MKTQGSGTKLGTIADPVKFGSMTAGAWPSRMAMLLFLLVALFVRGAWVVYQAHDKRGPEQLGVLSVDIGDTPSYLDPVEALLRGEGFTPDYRMPGVAAPYYLFRQLMDSGSSRDAYVVLQWLLSSVSVVILAHLAWLVTGRRRVFVLVYLVFLASTFTSLYVPAIGSDSLAVSSLIIHVFLLNRAVRYKGKAHLLGAGFFLTWAIFTKPVLAPLLLLAVALLFFRTGRAKSWTYVLWFLVPFIVIDGAWTYRNYNVNGGFHPLTNQGMFAQSFTDGVRYKAMNFVQGYGGDYIWWNPGAGIRWYGVWDKCGEIDQEGRLAAPPPAYAYAPSYGPDSLLRLSNDVRLLHARTLAPADSVGLNSSVLQRFDRYAEAYRTERPFQYHVLSRLRMTKNIFDQNGTESLFSRSFGSLPLWAKGFKLIQSFLYVFCFLFGTVGAIVLGWRWRSTHGHLVVALSTLAIYTTFIHPLGLRMCEWRYLATAYPFMLLFAVVFVEQVATKTLGRSAKH